jgi:hypothetical protein
VLGRVTALVVAGALGVGGAQAAAGCGEDRGGVDVEGGTTGKTVGTATGGTTPTTTTGPTNTSTTGP